jgi:hypothetical protein
MSFALRARHYICERWSRGWTGTHVHVESVKMGLLPFGSTSFTNALLSMYCKCGTKVDWLRAFGEIQEPDMVSCSTLLMVFDVVGCEKQIHGWCL